MIHVFAVSDATGGTAENVIRAALTQFTGQAISISRHGGVRTPEQVHAVIQEAEKKKGIIVHTLVSDTLRHLIFTEGRAANITTIDLMGPLLARLSELLSIQPRSEPGLFQPFDSAYLRRIDAIDFTFHHDDGHNTHELDLAEIILVGVSRTSKTPLSIYLSFRGWRVANVPLMLGVEPPEELFSVPRGRVIALVARVEQLVDFRKIRALRLGTQDKGYADLEHIRREVAYAYEIFDRRRDWPLVDVTAKSIEETAAEVVSLIGRYNRKPLDSGLLD